MSRVTSRDSSYLELAEIMTYVWSEERLALSRSRRRLIFWKRFNARRTYN